MTLGVCLVEMGQYEDAEPELLEAHSLLVEHAEADPDTQETVRWLVALYDGWSEPQKAEAWRAELSDESGVP